MKTLIMKFKPLKTYNKIQESPKKYYHQPIEDIFDGK